MNPQTHDGITSSEDFLKLATEFGRPIPSRDGAFITKLTVSSHDSGRRNTLSSRYGEGFFPFHTDTAFWATPARFVLLRGVSGNLSRATLLAPFAPLLEELSSSTIERSAWICDTGRSKRLTTFGFKRDSSRGNRYDPNCMTPANKSAHEIDAVFRPRSFDPSGQRLEWIPNRVIIIPNWSFMHARENYEFEDGDRLLERIYIA